VTLFPTERQDLIPVLLITNVDKHQQHEWSKLFDVDVRCR